MDAKLIKDLISSEIKTNEYLYIQATRDWEQKRLISNTGSLLKGRTIKEISESEPIQKTIAKHNDIKKSISFTKYSNRVIIPNEPGIYVFCANDKIEIGLNELFDMFVSLRVSEDEIYYNLLSVPKLNIYSNNEGVLRDKKLVINKGEVVYVGQSLKVLDRYESHNDNKVNSYRSLKLGLRNQLKDKLDFHFYLFEI